MSELSIIKNVINGVSSDICKYYKLDKGGYRGDSMAFIFDDIVNSVGNGCSDYGVGTLYSATVEIDVNLNFDDSNIDKLIDDSGLIAFRFSFIASKHLLYIIDVNSPSVLSTLDQLLTKFKLIGYLYSFKTSTSVGAMNLMAIHCANRVNYDYVLKNLGTMYVNRNSVYLRFKQYKKRGHMASLLY